MTTVLDRVRGWWRHPASVRLTEQPAPVLAPVTPTPAVGEQGLADEPMRQAVVTSATAWWPTYSPGQETRPNYAKCRALFYNRLPPYRLGAGYSRPIINAAAGFTAVPQPSSAEDVPDATEPLHDTWKRWTARLYLATRNSLRDGDVFVRLSRDRDRLDKRHARFNLSLLKPDTVTPLMDPISGAWQHVQIEHAVNPPVDASIREPYILIETVTAESTNIRLAQGQLAPAEVQNVYGGEGQTTPNPWGFIPIVQFRNESEEDAQWGTSDLEALDPLLRAYHDTLLLGLGGIQLFAKPKIKLHVTDRIEFLRQNFPEALAGRPINFQGREVIILNEGEDALYITADPGTEGVSILLKLLFHQIVQVAETPEYVFGTAIASSRASVQEQTVPFTKKIERKRLQLTEPMSELASMYLAMGAQVGEVPDLASYRVELEWPEVTPRDETAIAQTIKTLVEAFVAGVQNGLVSAEAAGEFLRSFVPSMLEWSNPDEDTDEMRRIVEGFAFIEMAQQGGNPPAPAPGTAPATTARGGTTTTTLPAPIDYSAILARLNGTAT